MTRNRNDARGAGGRHRCCLWPWAVVVLGFLNGKARAGEGGLLLGIQPQPHLATTLSYDDNINASPTDHFADFSVTMAAGLGLTWGKPDRNYLALDYTYEWDRYFHYTEFNADNYRASLIAALASSKTTFQLAQTFVRESVIIPQAATLTDEQRNSTTLKLRQTLSEKTAWSVRYDQEFRDYFTPGLIGYREFVPSASFFYRVLPKTELLGEVVVGFVDEASGPDALYETFYTGLTGQFSPKISGTVKVGYEHRAYSSELPATDSVVADVSLTAAFRERTSATLTMSYLPANSVTETNSTVQELRVALDLRQRLWHDRVTVKAGAFYEASDYAENDRHDQYWGVGAGLAYTWKRWAETGLDYEYENNRSSIGIYGYRRNVISWTVTAHF